VTREQFIQFMSDTAKAAGNAADFDREALREVLAFDGTRDAFFDAVGAGVAGDAKHLEKVLGRFGDAIDALELHHSEHGRPAVFTGV
jgi:hypothetical protein